jgi:predicted transport protein
VTQCLEEASPQLRATYDGLDAFLTALGDDVTMKTAKFYLAYRRIKNLACVEVHPQSGQLLTFLKVNPDEVTLEDGFTRDVREIGHYGTGDLEVRISSPADLERAKPLIERSYDAKLGPRDQLAKGAQRR